MKNTSWLSTDDSENHVHIRNDDDDDAHTRPQDLYSTTNVLFKHQPSVFPFIMGIKKTKGVIGTRFLLRQSSPLSFLIV